MKSDKENEERLSTLGISTLGITSAMGQFQNNWSNQLKSVDFSKISGICTSTLGITRAIGQLQNNWSNQLKSADFSKISALNTSALGLTGAMGQFQSNWSKQLNGIDFSKISALCTSTIGITETMAQFQDNWNKQLKSIDFNKILALNTSALGITGAMGQFQSNWSKQLNGIDFSKISALCTSTIGITETMTQFQDNWSKQFKNMDFNKIKINENGTIDYLDETINVKDVVEDVSSYFLEDKSTQQEVERNTEYMGKLNSIMNIILYVFLFVLIISIQHQSYSFSLSDAPIEQQITENIEGLNENIEHGLDEMAKLFLFIFTISNKAIGTMDNIGLKNPAQFALMLEVMKWIIKRIYNLVKKQKESIIYSDEILNDRKRTIKFIKKQINNSIKSEYDNEIVNRIFYSNFGLVNCKSLEVRSSNNLRSPIIYKLPLGEVVSIIDKNRKWTSIQFIGKDNCNYIGWVFTRYITRFD